MNKENDLYLYSVNNISKGIIKWRHYFDIYDKYFNKYRNKRPTILEIGVNQGGSLEMWLNYFGEGSTIYGVDVNPNCKQFESDRIKIYIGSQSDRNFLRELIKSIPPIDIIIDDGGHTMEQQIVTFQELFGYLKIGGIYICEDLHTSYWKTYGGGLKKRTSFIEFSKNLIDIINQWHYDESEQDKLLRESIYSLHYYDSMLVIEKEEVSKPFEIKSGQEIKIVEEVVKDSLFARIKRKINKILRVA